MCNNSFPPALLLFFSFFQLILGRAHEFHSLGQDQSTVTQRTETTESVGLVIERLRVRIPAEAAEEFSSLKVVC